MSAKPVVTRYLRGALLVLSLAGLSGLAPVRAAGRPEAPAIVLYPRTVGNADDLRSLVDLRKKLREDGRFQVLTYDPESAVVKRAAADAAHPEWLSGAFAADSDRLALARALGAAFLGVVAHADGRKADVHLVETADSARAWNLAGKKTDEAAHAIEQQAAEALAHPATAPKPAPPVQAPPAAVKPPPAPATVTPSAPPAEKPPVPDIAPKPTVPPPAAATPAPPVQHAPAAAPGAETPAAAPPATGPTPPSPGASGAGKPAPPKNQADNLSAVQSVIGRGDDAMARGDVVEAISQYRQAVNGAPLSVVPRIKLAQAYLRGGLRDKALDEARRALEVAPDNGPVQDFLAQLDAETGTSEGAVTRYSALVAKNPQDAAAHLQLGDAYWNNGSLARAETEYQTAQRLSPSESHQAAARLARLYATQARYDESLAALKDAGADGYALALSLIQNRADVLISTLGAAREAFEAGKSTRESFYDVAKKVSAQAQALADFVAKITPSPAYKVSHLHRVLATNLLSQEAAMLVSFIETSDTGQSQKAAQLEKAAQTEMLTAHAAEQKLGLWEAKN